MLVDFSGPIVGLYLSSSGAGGYPLWPVAPELPDDCVAIRFHPQEMPDGGKG